MRRWRRYALRDQVSLCRGGCHVHVVGGPRRGADPVADREERRPGRVARALGARATIDASREDPWQRLRALHGEEPVLGEKMLGSDAFVEASGAADVITQILQQAKALARLSVVALHSQEIPVNFLLVMIKQLTIRGAMEYPEDFTRMIRLLERTDLSMMISDRFGLDDAVDALALAESGESAGKVMVEIPG